jgi:hypothetical protein
MDGPWFIEHRMQRSLKVAGKKRAVLACGVFT